MPNLKEISQLVNGHLTGDPKYLISGIRSIERAHSQQISFSTQNQLPHEPIHAGALIVGNSFKAEYPNLIRVSDPYLAFAQVMNFFYPRRSQFTGISENSIISPQAILGNNISIGPFSYIGAGVKIGDNTEIHAGVIIYSGVSLGKNCLIYSQVTIREDVEIGNEVIIQPGAVIGADGFGFARDAQGLPIKIPQTGKVIIGNGCEIGANSCIDRATLNETRIDEYVKMDNLVQVGHNVKIGRASTLCGQVGISGSCTIGKNVVMGGQVGVGDHIQIEDQVMIAGKSGITGHLKKGRVVAGYPQQDIGQWRKSQVLLRNLEKYIEKIRELEKRIATLENQ